MGRNKLKLGLGVLTVLATPIAVNAVASSDALAAQGWVKSGNTWYFYNQNGTLARNTWAGNYWLGADGKMATNSWVDNGRYYVDGNGAWVKGAHRQAEVKKQGWVQNGSAWNYYHQGNIVRNAWIGSYWLGADGRMATSSWVDNGRYYVDGNGVWVRNAQKPVEKKHGWIKEGSAWYYYENGALARNKWISGKYWLGADGKMATSSWVDNGRYYVDGNGVWVRNAQKPVEKKHGWIKEESAWYYYENGALARNKWISGKYWLGADGKMATSSWVDNGRYYVDSNGVWVKDAKKPEAKKHGWVKEGTTWYYFYQGQIVKNAWIGGYWLGADGKMATSSWVDNNRYYVGANGLWDKNAKKPEEKAVVKKNGWVKEENTWYYYENGTLARNKWAGNYWLGADGKMATNAWVDNGRYYVDGNGAWVKNAGHGVNYSSYYKVTSLYIPVYDANGRILSHVSKDTVLFRDNRSTANGRIPVQVAGLTGYVNASQVTAIDSSNTFIPDYVSDGTYVYHRYSPYTKVMVAHHNANMQVGKSYYSADGINFGTFKLDHPFQFSNLKSRTNYTATDINRLYNIMGASDSKLAGKGATFKAAEQRYGVNALYLVAHSALESAWGRSKIAKDKNNFFGISAYDDSPYTSATKFDNVDSGIMGAARWINERYLHNSGYPANGAYLGNKAGGMNVNYATAPYWGESIASIMFSANEKLGRKDR
ncbi:glucosaminidase domain-containing protein [uncultured Gemella sp.]|uniref:glucosaminidase domain-containing protein n=1 Tax=uncultured Gemella sp. TaxID=254352 RepID=UPI0028D8A631|nr:glucosaminidase domain-containing protein [uncultured Gemella sp.]